MESDPKVGTGKKPEGSGRRLYTDENPNDTVSVKFRTKEDIVDTLNKESFKSKSHKRQSQIINLIHQRVRAAYQNAKDPETKQRLKRAFDYIEGEKERSKEKTIKLQNQNESELTEMIKKIIEENYVITEQGVLKTLVTVLSKLFRGGGKTAAKQVGTEVSRILSNVKSGSVNAKEISDITKRMSVISKESELLKGNYIRKYGQSEYDRILRSYLFGGMERPEFILKLKNVKNPNLQIKPVLGGGADHRIFVSKVNPDIIFKAEMRPGEVDKWYKTFTSNPDIFPKTYKKTRVRGENGEILSAVILEKLDTHTFELFWLDGQRALDQFDKFKNTPYTHQVTLERFTKTIKKSPTTQSLWKEYMVFFKEKYPHLINKINQFDVIVEKLYKVSPNPDIRRFNFGYDKTGKLKSLDI